MADMLLSSMLVAREACDDFALQRFRFALFATVVLG
jgi:hypothetical protein